MSEGAHHRLSLASLPVRLNDERRPGTSLCGKAGACRRGRRSRRRGELERKFIPDIDSAVIRNYNQEFP